MFVDNSFFKSFFVVVCPDSDRCVVDVQFRSVFAHRDQDCGASDHYVVRYDRDQSVRRVADCCCVYVDEVRDR